MRRLSIARFTAEDDCAGLPDPSLLARDFRDLDLFHPWDLPVEQAIDLARRCEDAAFATSPDIRNSEGGSVSAQQSQFISANSLGFMAGYSSTRQYITCSVIAGEGDAMQREDWYASQRSAGELPRRRRSAAMPPSARWRGWARGASRPPAYRCCSRRRWPSA
jgi:PmbA protein